VEVEGKSLSFADTFVGARIWVSIACDRLQLPSRKDVTRNVTYSEAPETMEVHHEDRRGVIFLR